MNAYRIPITFAAAIMLCACTSGGAVSARLPPRFEAVDCPSEITNVTLFHVTCGYLVVPQDRGRSRERTVRVFVSRWEPRSMSPGPVPVLYLGDDIGSSFDYTSTNGLVDNLVDRVVYVMEPRGVGHSRPNLSCPEIDALAITTARVPSDDPRARSAFFTAVSACHTRLVAQGIDPADYSVEADALDAEDLRAALGIERWDLFSKGDASRIGAEYLRRFGSHVHSAFFTQGELPGVDPLAASVRATRGALSALGSVCREERRCRRSVPHFGSSVQGLAAQLDTHPVTVHALNTTVLFDGATLLRTVRNAMATIPDNNAGNGTRLGEILEATLRNPSQGLRPLAAQMLQAGTYCTGYLPRCLPGLGLASGAYLSILCRDIAPFGRPAVDRTETGSSPWDRAFLDVPWLHACDRWDVPPASASVGARVSSDVPVLIVMGSFDPYDRPSTVTRAAEGLTQLQVDLRPQGRLPFNAECASVVRRAFFVHPSAPLDRSCTDSLRFRFSWGRG